MSKPSLCARGVGRCKDIYYRLCYTLAEKLNWKNTRKTGWPTYLPKMTPHRNADYFLNASKRNETWRNLPEFGKKRKTGCTTDLGKITIRISAYLHAGGNVNKTSLLTIVKLITYIVFT